MAITSPTSRKTNQMGSGFTNLQRVLQANKSNQLGKTVAGGVQQAGQAAAGAINQAGEAFKTNVTNEKNRLAGEETYANQLLGGNVANATDEDVNKFEGIRGGQTKGETSIKNADELAEKGREAQSLGQATGNEGGRFGLLQRYVGGNQRYTGGQQRLDNMLLGQTGQQDLRKARVATSGLSDKALNTAYAAEQSGQELQNQAKGLADRTIANLGSSVTGYDTSMQDRAKQLADARTAQVQNILSGDLEVEEPIYNQLSQVLDPKRDVLNTELNDYIKANLEKANRFGVQEQSDFDKIKALQKLSGNSVTGDAGNLLEQYNLQNPGEVGAFNASNMFTVPSDIALNEGISSKEGEYGGKKAANERAIQQATRTLTNAAPGSYSVDGGLYGQLLNAYNKAQSPLATNGARGGNPTGEQFAPTNYGLNANGDINTFNTGSKYIDDTFGHKDELQQAKDFLASEQGQNAINMGMYNQTPIDQMMKNIAQNEAQVKAAEQKQQEENQFYRVGRMLRKKPTDGTTT